MKNEAMGNNKVSVFFSELDDGKKKRAKGFTRYSTGVTQEKASQNHHQLLSSVSSESNFSVNQPCVCASEGFSRSVPFFR
jgi:hypothetical protein